MSWSVCLPPSESKTTESALVNKHKYGLAFTDEINIEYTLNTLLISGKPLVALVEITRI